MRSSPIPLLLLLLFFSCNVLTYVADEEDDPYKDYKPYNTSEGVDEDNDGIPDAAETAHTLFYTMPLYDWGARPGQKDLFVHVAPMDASPSKDIYDLPDAGMLLQREALDKIVAAFARQNIFLHFDVGSRGLYSAYDEIRNRDLDSYNLSNKDHRVEYRKAITIASEKYGYATVEGCKTQSMPDSRKNIFYFMVFGSSQEANGEGGSSGAAFLKGRDFLITLAGWYLYFYPYYLEELSDAEAKNFTINIQASTIMHELGHNLGLNHGGDTDCNYKPNYYSIMNYLYQLQGLPAIGNNEGDRYYYQRMLWELDKGHEENPWKGFLIKNNPDIDYDENPGMANYDFIYGPYSSTFILDYSHGKGNSLDETAINENKGLGQAGSEAMDYDGDGSISSLTSMNVNPEHDDIFSGGESALKDYNDWSNLFFYYNDTGTANNRALFEKEKIIVTETNAPVFTSRAFLE